ncbi:hypothetical protein [Actinomyces gerencseriae]|uniref:hypothetical protein n=1 Tax=Actinomyces gerencseriae TaxID=52769 RepID=UPI0028E6E013|nr:hypothetical protein [Actinomyces gerencseriae]
MAIDTHLDATPADIFSSVADIDTVKTAVDSAEDDLISARKDLAEESGETITTATSSISAMVTSCEGLVGDMDSYRTALNNLACALSSIKTELEGIREQATTGELTVSGETVLEPTSSFPLGPDPSSSAAMEIYADEQDKKALYDTLSTQTSEIRDRETEARQAFTNACSALTNDRGTKDPVTKAAEGFFAPDTKNGGAIGAMSVTTWGVSRAKDINKLVEGIGLHHADPRLSTKLKDGTVIGAVHKSNKGRAVGRWRHAIRDGKLSNWDPSKSAEGSAGAKAVNAARRAAPALKWAGRASNVLSFAVSAHEQWEKDSHNPSIGEGEKVTRAGLSGAGAAGGGWAGGVLGAKAGAAIGVCVGGPVGAAVGGIIGGVVGGAVGSTAGKSLADAANKGIHNLFHRQK